MADTTWRVADSANATYNGKLSTVNGFYQVEAANFASANATAKTVQSATVYTVQAITFSNAVNCIGASTIFSSPDINGTAGYLPCARGVDASLQKVNAVAPTMAVASPGVVTMAGHGYAEGQKIAFTTTGALLTGMVANTQYFVRYINANTFNISITAAGALSNFSGTQSGVHSCWADIAYKALASTDIINAQYNALGESRGHWIIAWNWTSVAVTTAASTFRLAYLMTGASGTGWQIPTSDGTNHAYQVWGNTTASCGNGDSLLVKDAVIIDKTWTAGTAATNGIWITTNITTDDPDDVSKLTWENPAAASYTLTLTGNMWFGSCAGFRVGTAALPITVANKAIITQTTTTGVMTCPCYDNNQHGRINLFMYGAKPTVRRTLLATTVLSGTAIVTTDVTNWVSGDTIAIGRENRIGTSDTTVYTVSSSSGVNVTLTSGVVTSQRIAGATIARMNGYGVVLQSSGASTSNLHFDQPASLVLDGVQIINVFFTTVSTNANVATWRTPHDLTNELGEVFNQCAYQGSVVAATFLNTAIHPNGTTFTDCVAKGVAYTVHTAKYGTNYNSGTLTVNDSACMASYSMVGNSTGIYFSKLSLSHNTFENGANGYPPFFLTGINLILHGNKVWGCANIGANGGAYVVSTLLSVNDISDNYADYCASGVGFTANFSSKLQAGFTFNSIGGPLALNNTNDVYVNAAALADFEFNNSTGISVVDFTNMANTVPGTKIRFSNYANTTNDDRVYLTYGNMQRTGTGLTDTTVRTSGAGKFGLRFQPTSSTNRLEWVQTIPTGNIQNKQMMVGVWVKINNANYYAGTNQLPRLTINYDNGTTVYAQAAQLTDWQFLPVPFNPATTYGSVTATISGMTDATSTDAYVYFDDFSVLYPAGYIMDASGLDLWANAEPVMPTISTLFSAQDMWNAQTSTLTGTGTIGKLINTIYQLLAYIGFVKK